MPSTEVSSNLKLYPFQKPGGAFAVLILLGITTIMDAAPMKLSQEQVIEMALERNFSITIQQLDPEIQEQVIRQEKAAFDPDFSVSYSEQAIKSNGVSDHYQSMDIAVEGKLPTGTSYSIGISSDQNAETDQTLHQSFSGITLSQSLLRGFGFQTNWASVQIADHQHRMSQWELKQTSLDVMLEVIYAYNQYFLVKQNTEIAKQNQELARQLVSDNRKRIEQGMMSPVDIAVAEAELAVREERVLQMEGALKIQENNLKQLIFNNFEHAINTHLDITTLPKSEAPDTELWREFDTTLNKQPELKIQQIRREIQQLRMDQALNAQRMDLTMQASYGRQAHGNSIINSIRHLDDQDSTNTSIGIRMSIPIGNRNRRSQSSIARLNLRQVDLTMEQMKQEILLNLHSAIILVETNWKRLEASRKAIELSKKMLEAEQKKLQAGTSSTFVVLRLQNDVADAQIQEYQTISDYNLSLAQLARLKGTL